MVGGARVKTIHTFHPMHMGDSQSGGVIVRPILGLCVWRDEIQSEQFHSLVKNFHFH